MRELFQRYTGRGRQALAGIRHYCYRELQKYGTWDNVKKTIEIVGVVGLLAYVWINERILNTMKDQTNIARTENELAERPWMEGRVTFTGPLVFDQNGAVLPVRYVITNTGKTPANYVRPAVGLFGPTVAGNEIADQENRTCLGEPGSVPATTDPAGFIIFPNGSSGNSVRMAVKKSDLEKGKLPNGEVFLRLIFCVRYKFLFEPSSNWHQTSYIYELDKYQSSPQDGAFDHFNPDSGRIEAGMIDILANPFMPGHVN